MITATELAEAIYEKCRTAAIQGEEGWAAADIFAAIKSAYPDLSMDALRQALPVIAEIHDADSAMRALVR